jgi:hypothetical protein
MKNSGQSSCFHRLMWAVGFGVAGLIGSTTLLGQTITSGSTVSTFSSTTSPTSFNWATDNTGNVNGDNGSSVAFTKASAPLIDLSSSPTLNWGTFSSPTPSSAFSVVFTANADTSSSLNGKTGAFVVVFDVSKDGTFGANDYGVAMNFAYTTSGSITIQQGSTFAFQVASTGFNFTNNTLAVSSVSAIANSYYASVSNNGAAYTQLAPTTNSTTLSNALPYSVNMAVALNDVKSQWTPSAPGVLTTAFSATAVSASASATTIGLSDWFGSSTSINTFWAPVPEPSTYVWGAFLVGSGAFTAWMKRRKKAAV